MWWSDCIAYKSSFWSDEAIFRYWNWLKRLVDTAVSVLEARKVGTSPTFGGEEEDKWVAAYVVACAGSHMEEVGGGKNGKITGENSERNILLDSTIFRLP